MRDPEEGHKTGQWYQAGSQPGSRSCVPKIGNSKISGDPIFQGRSQHTQIKILNM